MPLHWIIKGDATPSCTCWHIGTVQFLAMVGYGRMTISDSYGVSQSPAVEKCSWIIKGNSTCFALADPKTTKSSVVRHYAENGPILREMVLSLAIKSIGETLSQNIRDQERGKIGPASLLHSWHWVLFPISIEAFVLPQSLLFYLAFSSPFCFLQHWVSWTLGLHQPCIRLCFSLS